jgi:hypothetical protein
MDTHIPELQREASKKNTPSRSIVSRSRMLAWEKMAPMLLATDLVSLTTTGGLVVGVSSSRDWVLSCPVDGLERSGPLGSGNTEVTSVAVSSERISDESSVVSVDIESFPTPSPPAGLRAWRGSASGSSVSAGLLSAESGAARASANCGRRLTNSLRPWTRRSERWWKWTVRMFSRCREMESDIS